MAFSSNNSQFSFSQPPPGRNLSGFCVLMISLQLRRRILLVLGGGEKDGRPYDASCCCQLHPYVSQRSSFPITCIRMEGGGGRQQSFGGVQRGYFFTIFVQISTICNVMPTATLLSSHVFGFYCMHVDCGVKIISLGHRRMAVVPLSFEPLDRDMSFCMGEMLTSSQSQLSTGVRILCSSEIIRGK